MSVTSFVTQSTPIRERLAESFPKPILKNRPAIVVPSVCENPSLVGTAYDYLLRLHVLREAPFAVTRTWVAEQALERIARFGESRLKVGESLIEASVIHYGMELAIARAKRALKMFLLGKASSTRLAWVSLRLASCDLFFRSGVVDDSIFALSQSDFDDLRRLIDATDLRLFSAQSRCLLNPDFGEGTRLAGGADADLLVDDLLIEVKTTKNCTITAEYWYQILFYTALSVHFPIGGGVEPIPIHRIGFYFSRYNHLVSWPLSQVVDTQKFSAFTTWLRDYLVAEYKKRSASRLKSERNTSKAKTRKSGRGKS